VTYRLVHYTPEWEQAVSRCNSRLAGTGAAPFLLPARTATSISIRREHWLVVSSDDEVRGGCLLQFHTAWLGGEVREVINLQSPLSEGVGNREHAAVAPYMMRAVIRRHPHAYSVGGGGEHMPYMRLSKALLWRLQPVPFFFRVLHGRRFLRHARPLQRRRGLGLLARVGASVPFAADLAFEGLHGMRTRTGPMRAVGAAMEWSDIRTRYGFAVERTPNLLDALYPRGDLRFHRVAVFGGLGILAIREFHQDKYFGDLRVLTLAEMLVQSGAEQPLLAAVLEFARGRGADLLVTNQSAPELCMALRAAGWLQHASNYIVSLAPALASVVEERPVYVTRGDGDGLLNL
jgi:hypothetical protein